MLIMMFTNVIDLASISSSLNDYRSSMAVIALTFSAFAALFIIALPLNKFRLIVIFVTAVLAVGAMFLDQLALDGWFLTIELIKEPMHIIWIAAAAVLSLISHIALRKGIYHIDKKWGDKLEKTFADIKKLLANKRRKKAYQR